LARALQSIVRMRTSTGYRPLLTDSRFQAFLWTQFLGAFNDNVYKMIVSILAVRIASDASLGSRYLALAGAVFVIPFLLFAGYAGQIADRFSKTRVLQITKSFEIVVMLMGIAALLSARIELLLLVLFLLALQANFFSPAKYGILPEMMGEDQISRANGLLELTTFVAIVVGTSFGTFLFARWSAQPLLMGGTLLGIAVAGTLLSLHIRKVPAAGSHAPFRWNPFQEVIAGVRDLRAKPALGMSVLGISWFWFVGGLFQLALILAGREVFHVSEIRVGLLVTALAAGIGVGSLVAGSISGDHIELGLVPFGSLLMGLFSLPLAFTHSFGFALFLLTGIGFSAGLFAVPLNAYLQEHADPAHKGRILTTNNFANMLGVILASGFLALLHDVLGWNAGIILSAVGALMLLGTIYIVRLLPDITVRFVLWLIMVTFFRVRVEGRHHIPRTGGALLVSNHISYADSVLVGQCTSRIPRFLMWRPIYNTPGMKFFFEVLHAIPINAESPKSTILALRQARAVLESGELVAIFPEGSITRTGEIEAFQRGFERIVDGLDTPIVPMHVSGLWGHPLSTKGGAIFASWEKLWRPIVEIKVGEPIYGPISPADLREIVLDLAHNQTRTLVS
jgi:acyl-[acyl-carrier-protein]-phospholipid O-acyltransferase/long-chain-fatty-acid--[acyl-carrier-protein] ligase